MQIQVQWDGSVHLPPSLRTSIVLLGTTGRRDIHLWVVIQPQPSHMYCVMHMPTHTEINNKCKKTQNIQILKWDFFPLALIKVFQNTWNLRYPEVGVNKLGATGKSTFQEYISQQLCQYLFKSSRGSQCCS